MNDAASRVASLIDDDGTTHLVNYNYLGRGSVVEQASPQPDLLYTLVSLPSSNDPDTGDIYAGLDRFGRVKDLRWRNTDLSRVEYGYNRASNRIWRRNPTDPNAHYDWHYTYDAIQRLKSGERGTLNSNGTAITDPQFAQCWSLDETGNWQKFLEDDNGDQTWNLNQSRTSSTVSEITNISETAGPSWVTPAYSKAGNMTTMPQPANPTASFTATYDAWNRLTILTDGTDTAQENVYDGRNFRVIQKTYIEGDLDETRQYYFTNTWQVIEVRLDASSTPDRHFVWGIRYIDDLICRDRSESDTLDERLYPLPDANWNVASLVNTSGLVVERIEYDPYGETTWLSPTFATQDYSSYAWEATYCGYRYDAEAGLLNVRHRVYNLVTGTWVLRVPLGLSSGLNMYNYVFSNPTNLFDPYGDLPPSGRPPGTSGRPSYIEKIIEQMKKSGECKRTFSLDLSWEMTVNGGYPMPASSHDDWDKGCVGVTGCHIGANPGSHSRLSNCYATLKEAEDAKPNFDESNKCCSALFSFRYYTGTLPNDNGIINWNDEGGGSLGIAMTLFDFQYFDPKTGFWFGATASKRSGGVFVILNPDCHREYNTDKPGGFVVYCLTCKGDGSDYDPDRPISR